MAPLIRPRGDVMAGAVGVLLVVANHWRFVKGISQNFGKIFGGTSRKGKQDKMEPGFDLRDAGLQPGERIGMLLAGAIEDTFGEMERGEEREVHPGEVQYAFSK